MNTEAHAWDLLPDFGSRLQDALDHAGLTAVALASALSQLGLHTSPKYIANLCRSAPQKRTEDRVQPKANPTILLVSATATACDVPVDWFFQTGVDVIDIYLANRD